MDGVDSVINNIDRLPNEILLSIFKFLPDRAIVNVTSTCNRYLKVGKKLRDESRYNLWNKRTVGFWDIPADVVARIDIYNDSDFDSENNECCVVSNSEEVSLTRPVIEGEDKGYAEFKPGYNEVALKYLIEKGCKLKRGDLIRFQDAIGYRNEGVSIYNGKEIIELESHFDDYGHLPREFKAIDEFPIGYFHCNFKDDGESEGGGYEFITHNCIIWFDHKPYLTEILENLTIGKHPNIKTERDILYTHFVHKNGRKYYIIVCGEEYYDYEFIGTVESKIVLNNNAKVMATNILKELDNIPFDADNWIGIPEMSVKDLEVLYLGYCDPSIKEE